MEARRAASPHGRRRVSSSPSDAVSRGRFLPGTMPADRYRIVGFLGRGGKGEVYRADDLKLGQPVGLKFLPESLERDESRLRRFLSEVRTARQAFHSSGCRVCDVAEMDGHHFLSMESVDGEDLASLLRGRPAAVYSPVTGGSGLDARPRHLPSSLPLA